jgi:hypothetical protein
LRKRERERQRDREIKESIVDKNDLVKSFRSDKEIMDYANILRL